MFAADPTPRMNAVPDKMAAASSAEGVLQTTPGAEKRFLGVVQQAPFAAMYQPSRILMDKPLCLAGARAWARITTQLRATDLGQTAQVSGLYPPRGANWLTVGHGARAALPVGSGLAHWNRL